MEIVRGRPILSRLRQGPGGSGRTAPTQCPMHAHGDICFVREHGLRPGAIFPGLAPCTADPVREHEARLESCRAGTGDRGSERFTLVNFLDRAS